MAKLSNAPFAAVITGDFGDALDVQILPASELTAETEGRVAYFPPGKWFTYCETAEGGSTWEGPFNTRAEAKMAAAED